MSLANAFEELVIAACAYAPKSEKNDAEKDISIWRSITRMDQPSHKSTVFVIGDFNGHVGKDIVGLLEVLGEIINGKWKQEGRMILWSTDAKHLFIDNT